MKIDAVIDKKIPIPRYYQLAEHIRSMIHKKNLSSGDHLWSERQLMKKHKLSLSTVRQAYQLLIDEGLVIKEHGRGAFVADNNNKKVKLKAFFDISILSENEWQKLVGEFNKEHPFIEIDYMVGRSFKDYGAQVERYGPDIIAVNESNWHWLHHRKLLLSLQSFVKKDTGIADDFCEGLLNCFTKEREIFGMPYRFSTLGLFYNQNLFEKYGLAFPNRELTWEEFLELARKLTVKKQNSYVKHYGFGFSASMGNLSSFIWQNNGKTFSPEMECFFESKAVKDAIKFWIEDMLFKYQVSTIPLGGEMIDLFIKNKIAMFIGKYDMAQRLRRKKDISWGVVTIPRGKSRASSLAVQALAISSKTVSASNAWEFIKFAVSPQTQQLLSDIGWGLPADQDIAANMPWSQVFIKMLKHAKPGWPFSFQKPRDIITDEIRMLMSNLQSAEITCNRIARKCRKLPKNGF